jgi:outer membrane biosynthesis protein TonB
VNEFEQNPRKSHLRVAYVWRDEVMADLVASKPRKITLGGTRGCTFVTPDLGLPKKFAIIRHGARGYLLTLGAGMTGRLRLGDQEIEVAEFVMRGGGERAAGAKGNFRATSIAPGDWGVIHLDGSGRHNVFFQFVKADPPMPRANPYDSHLLVPALLFAVILHGVFVAWALSSKPSRPTMAFPGKREIMAEYLLIRPPPPPEEKEQPKGGTEDAVEEDKPPSATVGKEGKAGGEGEKPRAKAPDPDQGNPDEPPASVQVGLLSKSSRKQIEKTYDRGGFEKKLGQAVARLQGAETAGGFGSGSGKGGGLGPGVGSGTSTRGGTGSGGGGTSHADAITHGPVDTGGVRAAKGTPGGTGVKEAQVKVDLDQPDGDLGGLTAAEILKVVKSKRSAIATCYERELQRSKGLGGKVIVSWKIDLGGSVQGAKVRSTTMRNDKVQDCIVRVVQNLKFPQPRGGKIPVVNFPFLFAPR